MSLDPFDDSLANPQQIGGETGTVTGATGVPDDPVDYFQVSADGSGGTISLSFNMTTDLRNLTNFFQYITFVPVSGFEDENTISFFVGGGDFELSQVGGDFEEGFGTPAPVSLDLTPGEDVIFTLSASGLDYDNGVDLNIVDLPNLPNIPNLPDNVDQPVFVPINYSVSVTGDTGSGGGGSGGSGGGGGGGGGTPTIGSSIFDLVDAFTATALANLVDFDGNTLGAVEQWLEIGRIDVEGDGDLEVIMINELIGRWATLGITADGKIDFSANGEGGDTRVVGIYVDPLVADGTNVLGGPFDSQTRFANDIQTGNLGSILGAGDYDGDGFQEVYFGLKDGSAVLHAYMHADGNIRYANYQSEADLQAFMQANGIAASVYDDWF